MGCPPLLGPLLALLALAACASHFSDHGARLGNYVGGPVTLECSPFARALSGVQLSGAAADWWWTAEGRYPRSHLPEVGSVLVLQRSRRLPNGHVAVVSRVVSAREILVTQANWVHHRVTADQPVIDVSAHGDWSVVRVWWPPEGQMGISDYAAFGFIGAMRPMSHERLMTATPWAVRAATNGG